MPIFDFHCKACDNRFERLVRSSSVPACGRADVKKQISAPAAPGQSADLISRARAQAAREGHFSNYRPSELPRKRT
ncbi:MAG: zinc ribbon domain-containing protein [Oxalobacteraceae bacterium]|nr:zinc ribbon domain-containing protein [Oxalobacteraceae bacterium]